MDSEHGSPNELLTIDGALALVAELFEESPADVSIGTSRAELAAWDSLGQLVLMSALDQRFGIRLTPDELASLDSVQSILDVLERHGRLARS